MDARIAGARDSLQRDGLGHLDHKGGRTAVGKDLLPGDNLIW